MYVFKRSNKLYDWITLKWPLYSSACGTSPWFYYSVISQACRGGWQNGLQRAETVFARGNWKRYHWTDTTYVNLIFLMIYIMHPDMILAVLNITYWRNFIQQTTWKFIKSSKDNLLTKDHKCIHIFKLLIKDKIQFVFVVFHHHVFHHFTKRINFRDFVFMSLDEKYILME